MSTDVNAAAVAQQMEQAGQPEHAGVTPEEWLLLRFYRQLDAGEQAYMRRAMEALVMRKKPR